MRELVAWYVAEMPRRIGALEAALAGPDRAELGRLAHQLKGSAGGYGFDVLTRAAAEAEAALALGAAGEPVRAAFENLLSLMCRARAG